MKTFAPLAAFLVCFAVAQLASGQDAAQPSVDLPAPPLPKTDEHASQPPLPQPAPDVPELAQLDEAFKRTSIGKAADEFRQRVEIRKLQNRVSEDDDVQAAKRDADLCKTDLEKRDRLRAYYTLYYGKMRRLASDENTKKALDDLKGAHIKFLEQPRVRPVLGAPLPPVPKKEKVVKKKSRFGRSTAH